MVKCERCGTTDPDEKYVKDVATERIYCDWCASELRRICWGD
jgi:hypothetical protein